jgi:Mg2+/Co2+ transporter CorB
MGPVSVRIGGFQLDVEAIQGNTITQVRVTPLEALTVTSPAND